MSFKLLAIRPVANCESDFLKNLQKNYIYRFYNEYDYLIDREGNEVSIIDTQYNLAKEEQLDYCNVQSIRFKNEIPQSFYGNKVNVSAIVGKNGSGKSSLLELLYAFIFNISKKRNILKFKDRITDYNKISLEIYYEFNDDFYKISHSYKSPTNVKTIVYRTDENFQFIKYPNAYEVIFKFYSLVINYSIYSLNSAVSGPWIEKLFHKNDGYQSPIVINPFRNEGNIDVNNEYNLAQQRLILNHFVIKNDNIIDNINIQEVNYFLNIRNAQYFNNDGNSEESQKLIIDDIISFFDVNNFSVINRFSQLINILFGDDKELKNLSSLKIFLQDKDSNRKFSILELSDNNFQNEIRYLCLLYIFKKLKRISFNYEEYKIYNYLFENKWDSEIFDEDIKQFKSTLQKKMRAKSNSDIIDFQKYSNQLDETFKNFVNKNPLINSLKSILNNDVKFEVDNILESIAIDEKDSKIDDVVERIFESLVHIVDQNRVALFENYISELKRDDTHVAFKFRQAVNYFISDLFSKIKIKSVLPDHNKSDSDLYNIIIDQKHLSSTQIHKIPISFFEPEILVKKGEEIYPFNRLSSGEQHMIHSMLNITYHLYNISSVKRIGVKKKKYEDIIIIFDEVELYFHPEFQRGFIKNLLKSIEYFHHLSFNIIFSTHSPFILSDIPNQNILRLVEGLAMVDENGLNSFGANMHDLLADEFFLNDGFMGEFAKTEINQVIDFLSVQKLKFRVNELKNQLKNLQEKEDKRQYLIELRDKQIKLAESKSLDLKYDKQYCKKIIEIIGEPMLSSSLMELFTEAYPSEKEDYISAQINRLSNLIKKDDSHI